MASNWSSNSFLFAKKKHPTLGRFLFTFAIVTDSHINPDDDTSSSPWESNRMANARNRYVVNEINRISPEFVIHLGDMVHPIPDSPVYPAAIDQFNVIYKRLTRPLHVIPGNHDVGDKPSSWVPATSVNDEYLASYRRYFQEDFFSFTYQQCRFVLLNCQLLGSHLPDETKQLNWLKKQLGMKTKQRTFLFTHYPPYIAEPNEAEHYDNLKEPDRTSLLNVINDSDAEALFSGHVHNFFFNRFKGTDCYVLPSTTFVRHDYSELSRISAPHEFGRNDPGKLGFFTVQVYERGHAVRFIRTWGRTLDSFTQKLPKKSCFDHLHPRESWWPGLGLDMRHPWAESVELPYSGAIDEFTRKIVRNDYPLLALWDMSVKRLRIPQQDLVNQQILKRIQALKESGHRFTVFFYEQPSPELINLLRENPNLIEALEMILPWQMVPEKLPTLIKLKDLLQIPVYLSRLRSSADTEKGRSKFQHFIKHGFLPNELDLVKRFLEQNDSKKLAEGFVFRISRLDDLWQSVMDTNRWVQKMETGAQYQVMLSNESPAVMEDDDLSNANQVAEAFVLALIHMKTPLFLDTFVDMDRGYFPRNGLVDRRFNPRMAGHVYRNLNRILGPVSGHLAPGTAEQTSSGKTCTFTSHDRLWILHLPNTVASDHIAALPASGELENGPLDCYNLQSGDLIDIKRRLSQQEILVFPQSAAVPCLFTFKIK